MIYLTFGDQPSGVYSSQVIEVCKHLEKSFHIRVKLIAFISLRSFLSNRSKIKAQYKNSVVLPMFPKMRYWRFNLLTLSFISAFNRKQSIIARNVIAMQLALKLKKFSLANKVCYDGRGAIAAEWNEYNVTPDEKLKSEIFKLEAISVKKADFRISVSSQLITYWADTFGYQSCEHVIIPCTSMNPEMGQKVIKDEARKKLNISANNKVLIYAGSVAGWQSFELVHNFLKPWLQKDTGNKIVFLSKEDKNIDSLKTEFPEQIIQKWVSHQEVGSIMSAGDYGLLIREKSVTNRVSSPTKFAEYLAAGLPVLISDGIGDYTDFVREHNCGIIVNGNMPASLPEVSNDDQFRYKELVHNLFTKEAQNEKYKKVLKKLNEL
ncbi:MAG TPA: hypothetical protein PKH65_00220 [Bacteroidia bacterium]|nr:hypothetical protein [Bacteroidia bacterium]HNT79077.1 hypothetical protein [Bacteroidia bacterium]